MNMNLNFTHSFFWLALFLPDGTQVLYADAFCHNRFVCFFVKKARGKCVHKRWRNFSLQVSLMRGICYKNRRDKAHKRYFKMLFNLTSHGFLIIFSNSVFHPLLICYLPLFFVTVLVLQLVRSIRMKNCNNLSSKLKLCANACLDQHNQCQC